MSKFDTRVWLSLMTFVVVVLAALLALKFIPTPPTPKCPKYVTVKSFEQYIALVGFGYTLKMTDGSEYSGYTKTPYIGQEICVTEVTR